MATFAQVAYAIQDLAKVASDDSLLTMGHIRFLMAAMRNAIVSQRGYKAAEADYQTICVPLQDATEGACDSRVTLRSAVAVPPILRAGIPQAMPPAGLMASTHLMLVDRAKLPFVGHNKWHRSLSYAALDGDRLVVTGQDGALAYMPKVRLRAIFDDVEAAAAMECDDNCDMDPCDTDARRFPLQDAMLPSLISACVQEVTRAAWQPRDDANNANDDMSTFAQALAKYTNTAFKNNARRQQQPQGNEQQQPADE